MPLVPPLAEESEAARGIPSYLGQALCHPSRMCVGGGGEEGEHKGGRSKELSSSKL